MKHNNQWQLSLIAVLLVTINACNQREKRQATTDAATAQALADVQPHAIEKEETPGDGVAFKNVDNGYKQVPPQVGGKKQAPAPQQLTPQQPVAANPDWNKKIIKNATLSVEVKDYAGFSNLVRVAVEQLGGYVAQEEQSESEYKIENNITIKVPVEQFDNTVRALTPGKEKILVKKITSQDVTGEVVDTKARLEAKRQVRERYLDLLKQARNMEEILRVQSEIDGIQENMEAATSRVNYLTHAAAYSTIQLNYYQVLNAQAKDVETPPGFGQKVLVALKDGLKWVGDLIVLLLTLWPVWLALVIVLWLYRKYRPAKKAPVAQPAPTAEPGA